MTKRVLFINRQPPHGRHHGKEQLQMAMVYGAFEQHVSLLFVDDGVFALMAGQLTDRIGFENYSKMYLALDKYYDIEDIYVEQQALTSRNLTTEQLLIPVKVIGSNQIDQLMRDQDFIFST